MSQIVVSRVTDDGEVWFREVWQESDLLPRGQESAEFQLTPHEIQRHGLVDAVREAISPVVDAIGDKGPRKAPPEPQEGISEATDHRPRPNVAIHDELTKDGPSVQEVTVDGWRAQRVQDGDRVLWAIDNKPAIQAMMKDGPVTTDQIVSTFQHAVIPAELIEYLR